MAAREMTLPELGENIESAEVLTVLVASGDAVAVDQPILELETDKATAEVPAAFGGVVREVRVKPGDQIRVGQVLLLLDAGAASAPAVSKPAKKSAKKNRRSPRAASPSGNTGAAPTGAPTPRRPARDRSTSPSAPDRPGPASGSVARAAGAAGEVAAVRSDRSSSTATPAEATGDAGAAPASASRTAGPASPSVRRLAHELGIDLAAVTGTGKGGRISAEDLKGYARAILSRPAAAAAPSPAAPVAPATSAAGGGAALPDFARYGEVERKPMSGIRRRTAAHLTHAWNTIPLVTQFDHADVTALEQFRKKHGAAAQQAGGKLTPTAIVVRVVATALERFPQFNASIDLERQEIIYKQYINIGVAVDTERGLLVPVVRDANSKNLLRLAVEIGELAGRARARKASIEDLSGATFTVTNLGGLGTTYFSPLVNWPEVAILGVGAATTTAVWGDGQFRPGLTMPLSLSYDHRLIDGADAARFLRWVAEALENPFVMLLED